MKPLAQFKEVVDNPRAYAERWQAATGGKIVGTVCSYTPAEIIYAADALCFRVLGANDDFSLADTHLQAYCCSLVRGILNDVLAGRLDFLNGAVFPHTCDSMQRLSDIWRLNTDFCFHEDYVLPVKLDTLDAQDYMVAVTERFRKQMERNLQVEITEEKLHIAIRKSNRIRDILKTMDGFRQHDPARVSGQDLHHAISAAMIMDPDDWLAIGTEFLKQAKTLERSAAPADVKRLILAGGVCGSGHLYDLVEKNGGIIVHDDLCTGARFFEGLVEEHNDPVRAIAHRYLERLNCPAKHNGLETRGQHLLNTARIKNADGVIFLFLKFCDPHAFDYPYLKQMLSRQNIPSTLIETDDQFAREGHIATRVEAFCEMLPQH